MSYRMKLRADIRLIAAHDMNLGIGFETAIQWRLPVDLKFFAQTTMNHVVVMGRVTYESLPPKGLPNRYTVVLSSQPEVAIDDMFAPNMVSSDLVAGIRQTLDRCATLIEDADDGCVESKAELRRFVGKEYRERPLAYFRNACGRGVLDADGIPVVTVPIYVIGGQQLYEAAWELASSAYVTVVHVDNLPADRHFVDLSSSSLWTREFATPIVTDPASDGLQYHHEYWKAHYVESAWYRDMSQALTTRRLVLSV